jgi:hypothetical protein
MIKLLISLLLSLTYAKVPAPQKATILMREYQELRSYVEELIPDEVHSQIYKVKYFEDYEIVWNFLKKGTPSRNEFIRIYRRKSAPGVKPEEYFAVTYQRSSQMYPTRQALRRTWGYWPYEYRFDAVDLRSKRYIEKQGLADEVEIQERDLEILNHYNIQLFLD